MGEGDFFGEISLLEDKPRTATAAKTPLRFFVLTRQNFRTLLAQQPELEEGHSARRAPALDRVLASCGRPRGAPAAEPPVDLGPSTSTFAIT